MAISLKSAEASTIFNQLTSFVWVSRTMTLESVRKPMWMYSSARKIRSHSTGTRKWNAIESHALYCKQLYDRQIKTFSFIQNKFIVRN